jgi:hypothetical protein
MLYQYLECKEFGTGCGTYRGSMVLGVLYTIGTTVAWTVGRVQKQTDVRGHYDCYDVYIHWPSGGTRIFWMVDSLSSILNLGQSEYEISFETV